MATLVGYGSSDDEDGDVQMKEPEVVTKRSTQADPQGEAPVSVNQKGQQLRHEKTDRDGNLSTPGSSANDGHASLAQPETTTDADYGRLEAVPNAETESRSSIGPARKPAQDGGREEDGSSSSGSAPPSPRTQMQNLTMPPLPNFDIPPSPPGSPPPGVDARFAKFRELKAQGVHFNANLAKSSNFKNPALLAKLMAAAGLDERDQYASSLPTHLWDPHGFPEHAYRESLMKAGEETRKLLEEEKRVARAEGRAGVEFVSGGTQVEGRSGAGASGDGGAQRKNTVDDRSSRAR